MAAFILGLTIGVALGTIVVGFLAVGAYERGFADAFTRRQAWLTELSARHVAHPRPASEMRKAG